MGSFEGEPPPRHLSVNVGSPFRHASALSPRSETMPYCFAALGEFPSPLDLPLEELRFLYAARIWAAAAREQQSPRSAVANALGASGCAGSFGLFVEQLVSSFSGPFFGGDLDCLKVLPDEMLLIYVLSAAGKEDRARFESLLAEMVPKGTRDVLYELALRVHKRLIAAPL